MDKTAFYQQLYKQVAAIIEGEHDLIANMANISALLFESLEYVNWAGFYRREGDGLVLGPFQGKVACIRIPLGKGVCGTAAATAQTQRIADVHAFEGHIACDAASNSEIVIPVKLNDEVVAVLDIDSIEYDRFEQADQDGLEAIVRLLEQQAAS
ncbi:GAF domain-containing protein [Thalassotalea euphylliae]|uniref:GAF domain-containing protein n=1 Tax=Thalassotalea euphylliae TaxID=1655234 RepID=A0A3E0UGR6_9GAMM|nr:GAF domain-containing protein [Thalassotalea euphylliae]REL29718.1 GAF domain-containing protein [Thalassotalea euphylliae]REL35787.1 GAF domain-containing protein [Thalassotalea euphylliae]